MNIHKDLCFNVHNNFFIIAKLWKQLKSSSASEWIKRNCRRTFKMAEE